MGSEVKSTLILTAQDRTKAVFDQVERRTKGLVSTFTGVRTQLAALAGAAGFGLAARAALETAETFVRLNSALGIPVESLQVLKGVAAQTGVDLDTLARASIKLGGQVGDVLVGKTTEGTQALQRLGISARDLEPIANDSAAVMRLFGDRLNELPAGAERAQIAAALLGDKLALTVAPALTKISETIPEVTSDLDRLGLRLTGLEVERVAQLEDEFDRVRNLLDDGMQKALANVQPFASALVETFIDLAEAERKASEESGEFGFESGAAIATFLELMDRASDGLQLIRALFNELETKVLEFSLASQEAFASLFRFTKGSAFFEELKKGIQGTRKELEENRAEVIRLQDALFADSATKAGEVYAKNVAAQLAKVQSTFRAAGGGFEGSALDPAGAARAQKALDQQREQARQRLEQLRESLLNEEDALRSGAAKQIAVVTEAQRLIGLAETAAATLRLAIAQKLQTDLAALEDKRLDPLRQAFEQVRTSLLTEQEVLEEQLNQRLATIQENLDERTISEQQAAEQRIRINDAYWEAIRAKDEEEVRQQSEMRQKQLDEEATQLQGILDFNRDTIEQIVNFGALSTTEQFATITGAAAQAFAALGATNKKAFELYKKFALAEAIITGVRAVQSAYAAGMAAGGPAGPVVAAAYAAAALAFTAAKIAAIRSASFGGGSAGGGSAGGGRGAGSGGGALNGSSADTRETEQRRGVGVVTINLHGNRFDRDHILEIVEGLNEALGDNAVLQIERR